MAKTFLNVLEANRGVCCLSPGASMAGRACTVTNVSRTRGASMAPVMSPGSASVRPTGAVSSATKVHTPLRDETVVGWRSWQEPEVLRMGQQ